MPLRILVADGHTVLRGCIRTILEQGGFEVAGEALDGRDAIELARRLRPDMAVLDMSLPGLSGVAAARRILSDSPRMPVILLTMHAEVPYVLEAFRAGVRGVVVKGYVAEDLAEAVREVAQGGAYASRVLGRTIARVRARPTCLG